MTRMLGTVSDIGVNRAQTLAFGTLQGECKADKSKPTFGSWVKTAGRHSREEQDKQFFT
ncbi:hypothetical protein YC2023_024582 [Brassica napus]